MLGNSDSMSEQACKDREAGGKGVRYGTGSDRGCTEVMTAEVG